MTGPTEQPMPTLTAEDRSRNAAAWVLRICVAGMCVGYIAKIGSYETSPWPVGSDKDIRFWIPMLFLGIVAIAMASRPIIVLCIVCTGIVGSIAWHDGRVTPTYVEEWLTLTGRSARYLAPLALALLWHAIRSRRAVGSGTVLLLRIAAAATFAAHGYGALITKASFVALINGTFSNIGIEIDPVTSGMALKVIGAVDIIVAGLVLVTPWRPVVAWMAFWGFVAAGSRMTAYGWDAWYETAIRLPNGGVPLALLCLWWYRTDKKHKHV